MKNIILNSILFLSSIIFISCKTDNVEGIILENTLVVHQDYSKNRKMVSFIKSSLNKDSEAFKQLIHFPTGGGESSYNLGYVITQIIYRLSEDEIIRIIKNYNLRDLKNLEGMIGVGLEYGDNDYDGRMDETYFKNEFPKLSKYINEKTKN
ncbi:hypothetical protein [Winogradskyella helgolandensis]|uniref:hypothetical protein n=1 Tax=Winogradskyella helgolandensis TaxID=2697010 RepID=UPI0015B7F666|nr:hypothetical protein [Winogradskyella helgolandensis]